MTIYFWKNNEVVSTEAYGEVEIRTRDLLNRESCDLNYPTHDVYRYGKYIDCAGNIIKFDSMEKEDMNPEFMVQLMLLGVE